MRPRQDTNVMRCWWLGVVLAVLGCVPSRKDCDDDGDCPKGSICRLNVDVTTCFEIQVPAPEGFDCRKDSDCETELCQGNHCAEISCKTPSDCPADMVCGSVLSNVASSGQPSVCLLRVGGSCATGDICITRSCVDGVCACAPSGGSGRCLTSADCCVGTCSDGFCRAHGPGRPDGG